MNKSRKHQRRLMLNKLLMNRAPLTTYLTLCTEYYDLVQHIRGVQALEFYMQYAKAAHGPILEPMCGTGRFLIPMLEAGLAIEGFDASPYMLDALKKKYTHSEAVPVSQQFVEDFNSNKLYHLIFVPYGSWGLISDIANSKKSLANMYRHLAPGGKLLLEIETVASAPHDCGVWDRSVQSRADGSSIALNTLVTYKPDTQIYKAVCRYESIVGNAIVATETEDFLMYLFRFDEMDQLLREVGFVNIKKYQDYAKTPVTDPNSPIIIYECTK